VNFGCTGGQHRSVFCAEKLSKMLSRNFTIDIIVKHTELEKAGNDKDTVQQK
jgi:RNase adaptor protein for sRNA GlmZ degradation